LESSKAMEATFRGVHAAVDDQQSVDVRHISSSPDETDA